VSRARYDALRRATHAFVTASGGVEVLIARTVFGESVPAAEASNLRGRAYRVYDGAGVVTHERFDFAGNLRRQSRRLARGFEVTQDWAALDGAVPPTIEGIAAAAEPALEAETFVVENEYDALGRVIASTTPDQSVTLSAYNEAGLLESVAVRLRGAATPTSFVSDLDYNARGPDPIWWTPKKRGQCQGESRSRCPNPRSGSAGRSRRSTRLRSFGW
jgi:YD repeat-containing protein